MNHIKFISWPSLDHLLTISWPSSWPSRDHRDHIKFILSTKLANHHIQKQLGHIAWSSPPSKQRQKVIGGSHLLEWASFLLNIPPSSACFQRRTCLFGVIKQIIPSFIGDCCHMTHVSDWLCADIHLTRTQSQIDVIFLALSSCLSGFFSRCIRTKQNNLDVGTPLSQ